MGRILTALDELDIERPAELAEHFDRACQLKASARSAGRVDTDAARAAIAADLGGGRLTQAQADMELRKVPTERDDADRTTQRRDALHKASTEAYRQAHAALAAVGDELIGGPLCAVVDTALDTDVLGFHLAELAYGRAHDLARDLRRGFATRVTRSGVSPGNERQAHAYARPDLVHIYRVERAEYLTSTPQPPSPPTTAPRS